MGVANDGQCGPTESQSLSNIVGDQQLCPLCVHQRVDKHVNKCRKPRPCWPVGRCLKERQTGRALTFGAGGVTTCHAERWVKRWVGMKNGPRGPVFHSILAETVRFELTDGCPSAVFKTAGLNHSPKSPAAACAGAVF